MTIIELPVIEDVTVEEKTPEKCDIVICSRIAAWIVILNDRVCGHGGTRMPVCNMHKVFMTRPAIWIRCSVCDMWITIKDIWAIK